ncbi:MAG: N-acetylmuramoyl-L-alanine amidase [Burkholderiales bacterium]|nr:N-acetylmuramoyl-L-alanine amidase [Burkholderiales bacterium]
MQRRRLSGVAELQLARDNIVALARSRTRRALAGCALALLALVGCAPLPPQTGYQWRPSPNFDQRRANFVVIHVTTNSTVAHALATLTDPERKVSAHYLIGRDGGVLQLVDEAARAWHAGKSWWGGSTDLNSASIGIELDNTGDEPFAEPQIAALLVLLGELRDRHRIPPANFVGHGDVAPGRKVDPGPLFPWQRLAQQGFGLWCDAPPADVPPGFDPLQGLMAFGYDVARPDAAQRAFRLHFAGSEAEGELTSEEQAVLACLLQMKGEGDTRPLQ